MYIFDELVPLPALCTVGDLCGHAGDSEGGPAVDRRRPGIDAAAVPEPAAFLLRDAGIGHPRRLLQN